MALFNPRKHSIIIYNMRIMYFVKCVILSSRHNWNYFVSFYLIYNADLHLGDAVIVNNKYNNIHTLMQNDIIL